MSRSLHRAATLALLLAGLSACDDEPVAPGEIGGSALVRYIEYPFGGRDSRQEGTFAYDDSVVVRYDLRGHLFDGNEHTVRHSYYTTHEWQDGRRVLTAVHVRSPDGFVRAREYAYEYDAAGRMTRVEITALIDAFFNPIHVTGHQDYLYDDDGRLIEVARGDGARSLIEYDANGDVGAETLISADSVAIRYDHSYDDGENPFRGMMGDGLVLVWGSWATFLSERNVVRTEVSVDGGPVVSVRAVSYESYDDDGYPEKSVQYFTLVAEPENSTVFVAEYEYGDRN